MYKIAFGSAERAAANAMFTKLVPSTLENTEERTVPSSLNISFTTSQERTLPLYRPATLEMWFWITDVRVVLSEIDDTQDGSWECQTRYRVRGRRSLDMASTPTERMGADVHAVRGSVVDKRVGASE